MRSKGLVINKSCNKCGKTIRHDYNGVCMDCADELGISEIFERDKNYKKNLEKARKWLE